MRALPLLSLALVGTALAGSLDESQFLSENDAAMSRMMTAMHVKSSGDADRDFVAMMIPHHQGAIDMAQAQLRYGRNEQLRRLAQEIIVTQQQEITVPGGPGMQIFSPDGKYDYVCSSFNPETVVITVADHQIVGHVTQPSPFCPNIAATPDGTQVQFPDAVRVGAQN